MSTITCLCGATAETGGRCGVVDIERATGFAAYWDKDKDLQYLCPVCTAKAQPHVAALLEIFGERCFYGGDVLRWLLSPGKG